jgi:hypothetical protein
LSERIAGPPGTRKNPETFTLIEVETRNYARYLTKAAKKEKA